MEESENNIVLHRQAGRLFQTLLYLFVGVPFLIVCHVGCVFGIIGNIEKGNWSQAGGALFGFLLLWCTYYFAITVINEEWKTALHVELTDTTVIGYLRNNKTPIIMEYSKIVEMREPKIRLKDWFILSAAVICGSDGNKMYISNQISRFGFCMETIRDRSKNNKKFAFPSWQNRFSHWEK